MAPETIDEANGLIGAIVENTYSQIKSSNSSARSPPKPIVNGRFNFQILRPDDCSSSISNIITEEFFDAVETDGTLLHVVKAAKERAIIK